MASNLFSPSRTQEGAALAGLVSALYSGDGDTKAAERASILEKRRVERDLAQAKIDDYRRKKEAQEAAQRAEADVIANAVRGLTGGADPGPVMDYRNAGGVVQPQAETADMPGIMGGYGMDRPAGYTPQVENLVNNLEAINAFARTLPGKTNAEQFMKGAGELGKQKTFADVLAGIVAPERAGAATAAVEGKPLYHDTQGRILNQYSGALNEGGAQATASVANTTAQAAERNAHAGLYGKQAGAILPNQTITGPGGITIPVTGNDISRNLTASMFGPKAAAANDPNAPPPGLKLKPGERWNPQAGRVDAVLGSSEYQRQSNLHAADKATIDAVDLKVDSAMQKINDILDPANKTGFEANFGGWNAYGTRLLPADSVANMRNKIEGLKSDLKSAGLEMMRAGGSIGQITQAEWPIVEGMIARVNPELGEQAARDELTRVAAKLDQIRKNARARYENEWRNTQFFGPQGAPPPDMAADGAPVPATAAPPMTGSEPTATNPATGEKLVFRNGQWQPMR